MSSLVYLEVPITSRSKLWCLAIGFSFVDGTVMEVMIIVGEMCQPAATRNVIATQSFPAILASHMPRMVFNTFPRWSNFP